YVSALANGGAIYKPQVVNRIVDKNGNAVDIFSNEPIGRLPFSEDVIQEIRLAMRESVRSGTARLFQDLPVQAAAKTGTAEVAKGKTINALFTAFAPFDNPEISITVLIEGSATNEGYAINVSHNFLKWYFSQPQ
ncbi:MAG: penicillin-binding transpeptidase domain-containing protein, partial [Candidatus Yanofskybacteria bacterium]|nr:penicillin-binding transpeptidase domain-containing protein [Candidatus Yanofskybacteria bacterium]